MLVTKSCNTRVKAMKAISIYIIMTLSPMYVVPTKNPAKFLIFSIVTIQIKTTEFRFNVRNSPLNPSINIFALHCIWKFQCKANIVGALKIDWNNIKCSSIIQHQMSSLRLKYLSFKSSYKPDPIYLNTCIYSSKFIYSLLLTFLGNLSNGQNILVPREKYTHAPTIHTYRKTCIQQSCNIHIKFTASFPFLHEYPVTLVTNRRENNTLHTIIVGKQSRTSLVKGHFGL